MKCTIPEISWHNREPVLSVHIQPNFDKFYRLATGGADCHVLIWQLLINENGSVKIDALSDLTRHQRAVNSVRWSPNGQYLATADDDANIIIWQLKTDNIPLLESETNDKETWIVYKIMRGHKEDIYDLCWSPNGLKLLSGSIDNTAILWDLNKGKYDKILTDHKGFVQGVAWDPKESYIATISTDRICRIFDNIGKHVKYRIQKGLIPVPKDHFLHLKELKYFHDDTFKSFFRRLDFSPDGILLAVPSGRFEAEDCKQIMNASLIFSVDSWTGPIAVLPSGIQCSTVVRFCPLLFELHEDGPDPVISLPYRMIIAVGTDHDVILFDTQQVEPFAYFKDIHYTRLTDLTWSHDGLLLIASSTDGYCSLITFEPEELGLQYSAQETETNENCMDISGCEELDESIDCKPKKMNLLEKWTVKTPKKNKQEVPSTNPNNNITEDTLKIEANKRKCEDESVNNEMVCKRIKPVPVECPKISDENKNINGVTVCKRIKPILIEDKKITNENKNKDNNSSNKSTSSKASPLYNFLKSMTKKSEIPNKSNNKKLDVAPAEIILDEVEARDAWKCENAKKESEIIVLDDDEYTAEFSLHLEDTANETVNNPINCSTDGVGSKEDTDNCVQINSIKEKVNETVDKQAEKSKTLSNEELKVQEQNNDEKGKHCTEITNSEKKTKRRIPLITLSSPKHKKK